MVYPLRWPIQTAVGLSAGDNDVRSRSGGGNGYPSRWRRRLLPAAAPPSSAAAPPPGDGVPQMESPRFFNEIFPYEQSDLSWVPDG